MRWADLCRMPEFVGRWVALDDVEFDDGHPIDGEVIALGKGYNKKDASQVAAQVAVEKLAL